MLRLMIPLVLGVMAVSAHAADAGDPSMAAMAAQCPAAKAWIDKHAIKLAQDQGDGHVSSPALRDELHRRAARDQDVRNGWIADGMTADSKWAAAVHSIEVSNSLFMRSLVWHGGFPTPAQVGAQGVNDAWLLVQHADGDPQMQANLLDLLAPRVQDGSIRASDYAMLVDRVRINQRKPQVYGSQYEDDPTQPGHMRLLPVEDPAHLDTRRASVGLMPSRDYTCALSVAYAPTHS